MEKKEFYESLNDEVKAKLKACKTEDEMKKVLADAGIDLPDELLETISGGGNPPCFEKWKNKCGDNDVC